MIRWTQKECVTSSSAITYNRILFSFKAIRESILHIYDKNVIPCVRLQLLCSWVHCILSNYFINILSASTGNINKCIVKMNNTGNIKIERTSLTYQPLIPMYSPNSRILFASLAFPVKECTWITEWSCIEEYGHVITNQVNSMEGMNVPNKKILHYWLRYI